MAILSECPACRNRQSSRNKKCKCGEDLDKAKRSGCVNYWIVYRMPDGKQRWEAVASMKGLSGNSIEDAKTALSKRIVQKKEKRVMDMLPDSQITFRKLSKWYLELEAVKSLKSYATIKSYLGKFNGAFGDIMVNDIKPSDLENLQAKRKRQGLSAKTIDDEINYVKTMVIKGFDNDKISGDALKPFRRIKKQLKGHANRRDRVLTVEEFNRLMAESPRHLKDILTVGYWAAMRKGEITSLTWDKIDLQDRMIRLEASDTKEGKAKSIPMAKPVYDVFKAIPRAIHTQNVFLYYGKVITRNFSQGLKSACKKAGITWGRDVKGGFIFHDLRHTAITDMRRAGVDKSVRMAITGHAINDMDQRYDVVEDSDKKIAIEKLENYRGNFAVVSKTLAGGE